MKKLFILFALILAVHVNIYADKELDDLNNLLKNNSNFQNNLGGKEVKSTPEPVSKKTETPVITENIFEKKEEKHYSNKVLETFYQMTKNAAPFLELAAYLEKNINSENKDINDDLILIFENYYFSIPFTSDIFVEDEDLVDKKYGKLILKEAEKYKNDYTELIKNYDKTEPSELKNYLKSLYDRNLTLTYSDRYFFFTVNYDKLLKYKDFLSKNMVSYLSYSDNEIRNPAILDNSLIISQEELLKRILEAEKSMSSSDETAINKEFSKMLFFHFQTLILGVDKDPVFNYETMALNDVYLNSYKKYIAENGKFSNEMKDYISYLESIHYTKDKNTYTKQVEFVDNIRNSYKLALGEIFY